MEKVQFKVDIRANAAKVYQTMLDKETYRQWTVPFSPSSYYEGSWEKGAKMLFIGISEEGKKGGMVCRIKENIPNQFVSVEYMGLLDEEKEITEGPLVGDWVGGFENYSFEEKEGITTITVTIDIEQTMGDYFNKTYPEALGKLKELCEG